MSDFLSRITEAEIEIKEHVLLASVSSFRVGGEARYVLYPKTEAQLILALSISEELNVRNKVIGNTTNLLFLPIDVVGPFYCN